MTPPVLIVTGLSGAGKTSALKALEDLGFECIDNVPLELLGRLIGPEPHSAPMAIGIDIRTRGFGVEPVLDQLKDIEAQVLFLDCGDEELQRRYAETRHLHPLAQDRPVTDGIALERKLVSPLRDRADVVLDTSSNKLGDLKQALEGHFGASHREGLNIFVTSFSYRRGLPRQADLVFDVRFLANPHYDLDLRPLTGRDEQVAAFIEKDPEFPIFFTALTGLLGPLLPRYAQEGKSYLTIALGCTGGRHRSVFLAEKLTAWLEEHGKQVHLQHRELED